MLITPFVYVIMIYGTKRVIKQSTFISHQHLNIQVGQSFICDDGNKIKRMEGELMSNKRETVKKLSCVEPVSLGPMLFQAEIPEEQGNVVVLYEVC